MQFWLMKSEPEVFSIDDLERQTESLWDGVRNYAARNHLKTMKKGDECFFYESMNGEPSIVGIVKVVKEFYQDPTTKEDWSCVDVSIVRKLKNQITLSEIKSKKELKQFPLVRIGRLSVMPVSENEWSIILAMEEK